MNFCLDLSFKEATKTVMIGQKNSHKKIINYLLIANYENINTLHHDNYYLK